MDKTDIRIFLESSPQYPNLLSVVQTLHYAGLDTQAGQCDWEELNSLDTPFLLHLKNGNRETLIIARWNRIQNCLEIYNLKDKTWSRNENKNLAKIWDGVVIYTTNKIASSKSSLWLIGPKTYLICGSILLIGLILLNLEVCYIVPSILGFIASCCLYFKPDQEKAGIIDRFCHLSTFSDCNRVEGSKYSSIFGIKMNCIALSFFFSQLLSVIVGILCDLDDILNSLYFISALISMPIIAYSTYGQLRIGRICPLCIIVALCIAIEASMFVIHYQSALNFNVMAVFCIQFILFVSILQYISDIKDKAANRLSDGIYFLKLKRKQNTFLSESYPVKNLESQIWLGDEKSSSLLTTIISPGCNHCKKVVSELIALQRKGLKFRWNIILGQTKQTDSDCIDMWIQHFLTDRKNFLEYLTLWSNGINNSMRSTPCNSLINANTSAIRISFDQQLANLGISSFPRIILDGRMLSPIYSEKDIGFLISDKNIIQ